VGKAGNMRGLASLIAAGGHYTHDPPERGILTFLKR
jgi:hypothetical protein